MRLPQQQMFSPMSRSLHKDTLDILMRNTLMSPVGNHLRRLTLLSKMICSSVRQKSCSLFDMSNFLDTTNKQSESFIKQAKRWLSSKWTDWDTFYAPYVKQLLSQLKQSGELIFILDGSETGQNCCTLMLSVLWEGYALPIVWHTRQGEKGHFSDAAHVDLMKKCQEILPRGNYRVVLLGDGEFDGEGLRGMCNKNTWEFVLRTSLDRLIDMGGESGCIRKLASPDNINGQDIVFVENAVGADNAILWRGEVHSSPLPLLTNMDLGYMACEYYKRRCKIECLFKRLKSAGFNLDKSKLSHPDRVSNLLIVVSFAYIFTLMTGILIKEMPTIELKCFLRIDRVMNTNPITVVAKALSAPSDIAYYIFHLVSKNIESFFIGYT